MMLQYGGKDWQKLQSVIDTYISAGLKGVSGDSDQHNTWLN